MTKEVLVSIAGLQYEIHENDALEVITPGEYYQKGEKHYILYEEVLEEDNTITKNTIKISNGQIDILRKGSINVHMTFEENKSNITYYNTPFGQLLIGLNTYKIQTEFLEDEIRIEIQYGLDVNYSHVSDCNIQIHIRSKKMYQDNKETMSIIN